MPVREKFAKLCQPTFETNKNVLPQGKISLPDWDLESGKQKVAIPADVFLNHVANLHCSGGEGK